MANATRRVLALHGYSQSAGIFSKRMGAIRKACGGDVEFVFVNAPHILKPVDIISLPSVGFEMEGSSNADSEDPTLVPRRWWKANPEQTKAVGLKESLMALRDVLKGNRFDGVFGFSQGAAMAALLSALLEKPDVCPELLVDGRAPHPPFEFCVCVSGFKVVDPISNAAFTPSYSTRTLHIIGKNDVIVVEERSRLLVEVSENGQVEEHSGGHFVPSTATWRKLLYDYLCHPSRDMTSSANSGTATLTGVNVGGVRL